MGAHGAGDGNRTHATSLEGWDSTTELHPHTGSVTLNNFIIVERKTGFEPATFALARRRSTTEPLPLNFFAVIGAGEEI